jgi:hypothetical protein
MLSLTANLLTAIGLSCFLILTIGAMYWYRCKTIMIGPKSEQHRLVIAKFSKRTDLEDFNGSYDAEREKQGDKILADFSRQLSATVTAIRPNKPYPPASGRMGDF